MDDMVFPSYVSSKAHQRKHRFGEVGDAFVREIDVSKITLRLTAKMDRKGDGDADHVLAKLQGSTLTTLQQCLNKPTELTLRSNEGSTSKVTVSLKYLPVKMQLDPSESINNMGTLRVDVLDATDLPSADRNGYSDPFCKFRLNGKEIFKTKVQKKTLHPAWNEFFEVPIASRTAADFRCDVMDWDFGDRSDHLGTTVIDLRILEPLQPAEIGYPLDGKSGKLRLKLLFKPDYVRRSRQGSSTFSGTFGPAGKVLGTPIKGVGLIGGAVGGGVVKGTTFLKKGFGGRSKGSREGSMMETNDSSASPANGLATVDGSGTQSTPSRTGTGGNVAPQTPTSSYGDELQHRRRSFGSTFSGHGGTPKGPDSGTATITILSAEDYPEAEELRVYIRMGASKGAKEVHKTKKVKPTSTVVEFSQEQDTFQVPCSAATQFQVTVKDYRGLFGGDVVGEGVFYIGDQGAGATHRVKAGQGTVVVQSRFAPAEAGSPGLRGPTSTGDSLDVRKVSRRSYLGRRDTSGKPSPKD